MSLYLHKIEFTVLAGELEGVRVHQTRYVYAHDEQEVVSIAEPIIRKVGGEDMMISLLQQAEKVTYGILVPILERKEAYIL